MYKFYIFFENEINSLFRVIPFYYCAVKTQVVHSHTRTRVVRRTGRHWAPVSRAASIILLYTR